METITLTLEATPENARKIAVLLSGAAVGPNEVVIPAEKLKEAIEKKDSSSSVSPTRMFCSQPKQSNLNRRSESKSSMLRL